MLNKILIFAFFSLILSVIRSDPDAACRHLFQRINEHKHSVIGKHLRDVHNLRNKDLRDQFTILKKCRGKLDCLIYEMLFIKNKKPTPNIQSDSIKAKLFIDSSSAPRLVFLFLFIDYFYLLIICTESFTPTFTI